MLTGNEMEQVRKPAQQRYRTGLVGHTGVGDCGHDLDVTCRRMPELEVVALADPVPAGRAAAAARSGARRTYASSTKAPRSTCGTG